MRKKRIKKGRLAVLIIVTLFFISLAGFAGYKAALVIAGWNRMSGEKVEQTDDVIEDTKFNVLLVGIDRVSDSTDVMMLVNVDTETMQVNISSIYRDTRVTYGGRAHKLNSVYKHAKEDIGETISAIKEITGAPINYYMIVDLEGFVKIIDELGGVDFYVPQDMHYHDKYQDLYIDLEEGMQHLDGEHAMQLVRFRKYPLGDVARAQVQQDFMTALIEQYANLSTIMKAPELFYKMSGYVKTDVTMGLITSNLKLMTKMSDCKIERYEMPGQGDYVGKISYFLQYEDEIYDMYKQHFMGTGEPAVRSYTDYSSFGWPDGWTHSK